MRPTLGATSLAQRWPLRIADEQPPFAAMQALVEAYLGPVRRAGQGMLPAGTPGGEADVLAAAGFAAPAYVIVERLPFYVRSIDDLVAWQLAGSASAPHLFGERLPTFEAELRTVLQAASPTGQFAQLAGDTELRVWRKPSR